VAQRLRGLTWAEEEGEEEEEEEHPRPGVEAT
jgi:hypothetical protein